MLDFMPDVFKLMASDFLPNGGALLLTFVVSVAVMYFVNRPKYVPKTVPGPERQPISGILTFILERFADWPMESMIMCRKFEHKTWGGPCFKYGAYFFTDDPINVKYILKDNMKNFEKSDTWRKIFVELLGNGIFAADGKVWETHRKISSRLFSRNLLRYSCRTVEHNCQIIVDQFEQKIAGGGKSSAKLDLQDVFYRLTIDSTGESTFGLQLKCLESEEQPKFAQHFDALQHLCLDRFVNPFFEIQRLFQLTRTERRIKFLKKEVDKFCKTVIQNKRKAMQKEDGEGVHEDLLGLFLKYNNHTNGDLEDEELRDVIMNFMVAGRDTTASGLSWTFYELSKRPDVVNKIVDEVNRICGPPETADYSFDNISNLAFTHCVVMEGLRLHPPVPVDSKFTVQDDTLPDGTRIPSGAGITYHVMSMGHSELLWGKDSTQFRPERFLDIKEPSAFQYSVFNAGPRMCLGKPAALATMKMVLAQLLPRFHFEDASGHSGEMEWLLVQKMKGGFPVKITKRSNH